MDCLTAIVSGIAGNIVQYTIEPVGGQMGYLVHHKNNLQNLESQVDNLGVAKARIRHTVNEVKIKVLDVKHNSDLERIQKEIAKKLAIDVLENHTALRLPLVVCKTLLTSRSREILSSEMRMQKEFGLHVLDEEETWSLFKKMEGIVVKDPIISAVATQIAQKCGGLLVFVVIDASTLRNKSTLHAWKDALRCLKGLTKKD
ncbi:hypothetical protein L3X38_024451 [Prunus dulcis]|uniref:NB-ARC domain-containing disease resistance protein n=1 Tax=Prunus dulcis TaxID=3755 RepID=A0AAD4W0Y3_PRUDU|nr:hypothetical protein L3X38_024451 [Prunus dulcis]